jgi:hypothetical protein
MRSDLAARVTFEPSAKHKRHPDAFGMKPYEGLHEDPTYCDDHAGFKKSDIPRAHSLLVRGVEAGLFGATFKKGDPGLLWSVDDNGWIYEAQITNPGYAGYHAYPVLPGESIARKVLYRYAEFVEARNDPVLEESLRLARGRYR